MPLIKGSSKKVFGQNVSEFTKGKTFKKTKRKFGKKKAMAQAVAVAYKMKGETGFRTKGAEQ